MRPDKVDWIRERVDWLTEGAEDVRAVTPDIYNSFDTWSALKLIVHAATVRMYTRVGSHHFDEMYYVDCLAGSGISEYNIDGCSECFLGSPIVAARAMQEPFEKMYFIESDGDKEHALRQRLSYIFSESGYDIPTARWEVIPGDANEQIYEVKQKIRTQADGWYNTLAFVDNEATDFNWDAVEAIGQGELNGDFLINYPASSAVGRNVTREDVIEGDLREYFGRDVTDIPRNQEAFRAAYYEQISSLFTDECRKVRVNIDSGIKNYHYDLIYATKLTDDGSEYAKAVEYTKKFVENVDGADVEDQLSVMKGDQSAIEQFVPKDEDPPEDSIDDEKKRNEGQSGLEEFL